MKAALALLGLAGSVIAGGGHDGGYYGSPPKATVTTVVDVTYTTVCPATSTVTSSGKTYVTTFTTTSTIYTHVPTTLYETITLPDQTKTKGETAYATKTELVPVTETKTINGETVCVTWTSTKLITTAVPTTVQTSITLPGKTKTKEDVVYQTLTELIPVTETKTINGETTCITWTSTQIIKTAVPTTIQKSVTLPDQTRTKEHIVYQTLTELIPVTETKTINGETICTTWTSTQVIKTAIPTTIAISTTLPNQTKTRVHTVDLTSTELIPVTETKTINGETTCITWTSTRIVKTAVPTTVHIYTTQETTKYVTTDIYVTTTCPVTTYTTIVEGVETCVTETNTKTLKISKAHTITEVHPVTKTKTRTQDTTVTSTICTDDTTVTQTPTVEITVPGGSTATTLIHTTRKGGCCDECDDCCDECEGGGSGATVTGAPVTKTKTAVGSPVVAGTSRPATTSVGSPVFTAAAGSKGAPAVALIGGLAAAVVLI